MMRKVLMPRLGGDPEYFIQVDGELVSAHEVLPPEEEKVAASPFRNHSFIFYDGVQGEMQLSVGACKEGRVYSIRRCLEGVLEHAGNGASIITTPAVKITKDMIEDAPEQCRIFGCEPDFSAYNAEEERDNIPDGEKHMWRYAGGHMHFGSNGYEVKETINNPDKGIKAIKAMDMLVGIPSVAFTQNQAAESRQRRKVYGQAGRYRYGDTLEYRTLSPFWITHPSMQSIITNLGRAALTIVYDGGDYEDLKEILGDEEVRKIINEADVSKAKKVTKDIIVPYLIDKFKCNSRPSHSGSFSTRLACLHDKYRWFFGACVEEGYDKVLDKLAAPPIITNSYFDAAGCGGDIDGLCTFLGHRGITDRLKHLKMKKFDIW